MTSARRATIPVSAGVLLLLALTGCAAQPTAISDFVVGTWDCVQTGQTPQWRGGNSNGTGYHLEVLSNGTVRAQMFDTDKHLINQPETLMYKISNDQLTLTSPVGKTVTTPVPGTVKDGAVLKLTFSGSGGLTDRSAAVVDGKTVKGIHWNNQIFTCSPSNRSK